MSEFCDRFNRIEYSLACRVICALSCTEYLDWMTIPGFGLKPRMRHDDAVACKSFECRPVSTYGLWMTTNNKEKKKEAHVIFYSTQTPQIARRILPTQARRNYANTRHKLQTKLTYISALDCSTTNVSSNSHVHAGRTRYAIDSIAFQTVDGEVLNLIRSTTIDDTNYHHVLLDGSFRYPRSSPLA